MNEPPQIAELYKKTEAGERLNAVDVQQLRRNYDIPDSWSDDDIRGLFALRGRFILKLAAQLLREMSWIIFDNLPWILAMLVSAVAVWTLA